MKQDDFLVEILTEELPPKALHKLGDAFYQQIVKRLEKADLGFNKSRSVWYATPRRLAVLIRELDAAQPDQVVERRGPALKAAYDAEGKPTPASLGFAKSCGVSVKELMTIKNAQGEWLGFNQYLKGKTIAELMPELVEQSIQLLPVPKYMRWGNSEIEFARPVLGVVMLYGKQVIEAEILGCKTGRKTLGHRFMSSGWIDIKSADAYESLLETKGKVIADFFRRKELIEQEAKTCVQKNIGRDCEPVLEPALLEEVTGLVEWPVALYGEFDEAFLSVPKEALISAMQDHQRYFPVLCEGTLKPDFVMINNIESKEPQSVVTGNERVLRARLSDAVFFYETDKQESLEKRVERLKGIVYQAKLGTIYDRAERLSNLAAYIADKMNANKADARRAGLLAKADLTTQMVGEFPELQGVMGYYYASQDGESDAVATALKEQYLPRFAGDVLPSSPIGQALALADKLDALMGAFAINQIPTGDKDPFGLRRAAIGVLRIMIEEKSELDLEAIFTFGLEDTEGKAESKKTVSQLMSFMQERLRSWYQEQGVSADIFAAVAALGVNRPLDVDKRIKAVQAFKQMSEAEALSIANKRVSNILEKHARDGDVNPDLFEHEAERVLFERLDEKVESVDKRCAKGHYQEALQELSSLRQPIDDFFDHVMVMTEDKPRRENRILLLSKLRKLFLKVADIALLQ